MLILASPGRALRHVAVDLDNERLLRLHLCTSLCLCGLHRRRIDLNGPGHELGLGSGSLHCDPRIGSMRTLNIRSDCRQ